MRVILARDIRTNEYMLLATERRGSAYHALEPTADGFTTWREVPEGGSINPLLRLPSELARELFAALAEEMQREGFAQPDPGGVVAGTKAHLTDTIAVRDRLFSLVEKLTQDAA